MFALFTGSHIPMPLPPSSHRAPPSSRNDAERGQPSTSRSNFRQRFLAQHPQGFTKIPARSTSFGASTPNITVDNPFEDAIGIAYSPNVVQRPGPVLIPERGRSRQFSSDSSRVVYMDSPIASGQSSPVHPLAQRARGAGTGATDWSANAGLLTPSSPLPPGSPYCPGADGSLTPLARQASGFFDSTRPSAAPSERPLLQRTNSVQNLLPPEARAAAPERTDAWHQRCLHALSKQVDPKFLAQLVNPKEIVFPITTKKAGLWTAYLGVIAGLVLMDHYLHLGKHVGDGLRFNSYILMGFIYGTEPAILLLLFALGRFGERATVPEVTMSLEKRRERAKTHDCALVIPAHNSDPTAFRHMLRHALLTFPPENIFVVDNANSSVPVGGTQELTRRIDPDINYMWMPLGNKNAAQYVGSLAVKQKGLSYVLVVDDDVLVPETFVAPKHLMNDNVKAVCFPIEAIDHHGKKPLFVAWQDLEYKMSGFTKLAEKRACGVLYPHGACSFWERDTLLRVLRKHDLIFFGEDLKLGLALMRAGKRMTIDDSQAFETEVPETLFGAAPNYYQQRVRSWEMGRHILYKEFFQALFGRNGQNTVFGFAVQKLMQSYAVASNVVDWIRVPLFVAMGSEWHFWARVGGFALAPMAPALVYKYGIARQRPDMAPSLKATLTFPVYKAIYSALSVVGAARSVYFYWPNRNKLLTIPEMEKAKDPRCIHLSPQFAGDPGFLARSYRPENHQIDNFLKNEDVTTEQALAPTDETALERQEAALAAS